MRNLIRHTLALLALLLPALASAQTLNIDGIYYNLLPNKTAEVTKGNYSGSVTIPSTVTYNSVEYTVTSIGLCAFALSSELKDVHIPSSVTSIGEEAFYSCKSLTSITIPNSVTSIGTSAFSNCSSLTSVIIPNSVTKIDHSSFAYCSSLTSVTIPNSVKYIGVATFYKCSSLTEVFMPNSITSIDQDAFADCTSLTELTCEAETPPILGIRVFDNVDKSKCNLYVPTQSVNSYKAASQWRAFFNIMAIVEDDTEQGDVNGDGVVTISDINLLIEMIMGGHPAGVDEAAADVNGDGSITIADVNALISKIMSR